MKRKKGNSGRGKQERKINEYGSKAINRFEILLIQARNTETTDKDRRNERMSGSHGANHSRSRPLFHQFLPPLFRLECPLSEIRERPSFFSLITRHNVSSIVA